MSPSPRLLAGLASAALLLLAAPATALPRYDVFDLGALLGPGPSSGAQINDVGQVIGGWGTGQSYLYTPGSGIADVGGLIGSGPGVPVDARGLNNLGQFVGQAGETGFVHRPGTGTEWLAPTFFGPRRINDAGQYIGSGYDTDHGFGYRFTPGVGVETLPLYELVQDLNASGQVAGYVIGLDGNQAARWDAGGVDFLGGLGTPFGEGRAINSAGDVVGYGVTAGQQVAFRYTDGGGMVSLDTLGHTGEEAGSFATAINDSGLVGGAYRITFAGGLRAFVTDGPSGMVDLNTLLQPSGSGWTIQEVTDINDAGQIVGNGLFNGQSRAFVLNPVAGPVPEPAAALLLLAGLPLVGWARRRAGLSRA